MANNTTRQTKEETAKKYATSKWGVGIGLGAAAAIAATSYFLYGTKEGAKRRAQMRGWMMKAKGEIVDRMEQMRDIDEKKYRSLVDEVLTKYKKLKRVDTDEVRELADDLKKHWNNIKKDLEKAEKVERREEK